MVRESTVISQCDERLRLPEKKLSLNTYLDDPCESEGSGVESIGTDPLGNILHTPLVELPWVEGDLLATDGVLFRRQQPNRHLDHPVVSEPLDLCRDECRHLLGQGCGFGDFLQLPEDLDRLSHQQSGLG
jgi:hypothetical protein